MLSGYTPKTQVSIIGTRNNVNKTANSVQSLMGYSSYKGEGTNYDYQSDFGRRPGSTRLALPVLPWHMNSASRTG